MTTIFKYLKTAMKTDEKGTYVDSKEYVGGPTKTLNEFISMSERIQLLGILYNHRFTIFNEMVKVLTLLDFKQNSELRRFADLGVMYNKEFYNFVSKKYMDVLVNSQKAYKLNVDVMEKMINDSRNHYCPR
jgi:hypothetical protein